MANKNNINRPRGSKPRAKVKPSHALKRISKATATSNHNLSSKKAKKLLRNKTYVAQRMLDEAGKEGGDIPMRDVTISRKKEKLLRNLEVNKGVKEQKDSEMDVTEDL
ncbi:hypothetical protein ABW19_dt0208488 [Dactylella cylindrospora]|nr:hypothetical protein ABW19_dt0208488 [Dactylella cylindrospora]